MFFYIVKFNGCYDILSALTILKIISLPVLDNIHLSMIRHRISDPIIDRFFAYWIFTYGTIRYLNIHPELVAYSYYIEALFLLHEMVRYKSIYLIKGTFCVIASMILGTISLYQ
jgi:hypothetical protein